jgi:hypothetical protein
MNESDFGSGGTPQKRNIQRSLDGKTQYLLRAEEQLLQSISARVPLPEVLNRICGALDLQIGNVVSLITLPGDDPSELAAIAMNAALFGLYTFCSEGVVDENDELLGLLEMYSCVERGPDAREIQLIERAKCLASIAIKLDNEADRHGLRGNWQVRGSVLKWPVTVK